MRRGILIGGIVVLVLGAAAVATLLIARRFEKEPVTIGVIHSLTGPLAVSEAPLLAAYRQSVRELNAKGGVLGRRVELEVRDGGSDPRVFANEAERLLRDPRISVLAGGWTSASRMAMQGPLARHHGLLLYPAAFEGLERSPDIVYLGSSANQQIGPAVDWALENGAKRFFLVGDETLSSHLQNAIARDLIQARGGAIVGERYFTAQEAVPAFASAVAAARPDSILNSVSGDANGVLMRGLRDAGIDPSKTIIVSLALTAPAIAAIGPELFAGTMLAASYVQSLDLPSNQRFLRELQVHEGADKPIGDAMASAYVGLLLWARAVEDAGTFEIDAVHRALRGRHVEGPAGPVVIDPETHYAWRTPRLGRVRGDGSIEVVWDGGRPVAPVPWPMWKPRGEWSALVDSVRESLSSPSNGGRTAAPSESAEAPSPAPAPAPAERSSSGEKRP